MKKLLIFSLAILLSFGLVGCGSSGSKNKAPGPDKVAEIKLPSEINVTVYLDGTSSMAGYVNFPGETVYEKSVFDIENIAQQIIKQANVKYVKFGDANTAISRGDLVAIKNVGFYNEKDTSIDKVVANADNKSLNVIVTDLFQTDQDLGSLVNAFQNKYLKAGKALAIIGIKSQFNGKIYDIGKNVASTNYASTANPESYRPVYFLVFGDTVVVRSFTKQFANVNKDAKVAFYAKELGENESIDVDGDVPVEIQKADKKANFAMMASGVRIVEPQDNLLQLRWKIDKSDARVYTTVSSDNVLGELPEGYSLLVNKFQYFDVPDKSSSGEFKDVDAKKVVQGSYLDGSLTDGKAAVNIALTFSPNLENKSGLYRLEFALIPTLEAYRNSFNNFDAWNFDDSALNNGVSLQTVGNKTLNLKRFLVQLANVNYENKPGFYHNWLYIEIK